MDLLKQEAMAEEQSIIDNQQMVSDIFYKHYSAKGLIKSEAGEQVQQEASVKLTEEEKNALLNEDQSISGK
jgi:hypothetical protein